MAWTRYHDEPIRMAKRAQENRLMEQWILDVPGNGLRPYYIEDPHIRIQKWGGNLMTNTINLESELMGLGKVYTKCDANKNYEQLNTVTHPMQYPTYDKALTHDPRITHPAWALKGQQKEKWDILLYDPQQHTQRPFSNLIDTRITVKEHYVP